MLEAVASICRFTTPIFHVDTWYFLTLHKPEMNTATTNIRYFDETPCAQFDASIS